MTRFFSGTCEGGSDRNLWISWELLIRNSVSVGFPAIALFNGVFITMLSFNLKSDSHV